MDGEWSGRYGNNFSERSCPGTYLNPNIPCRYRFAATRTRGHRLHCLAALFVHVNNGYTAPVRHMLIAPMNQSHHNRPFFGQDRVERALNQP